MWIWRNYSQNVKPSKDNDLEIRRMVKPIFCHQVRRSNLLLTILSIGKRHSEFTQVSILLPIQDEQWNYISTLILSVLQLELTYGKTCIITTSD